MEPYLYDGLGNVAAEVGYNSAWYTLSGLLSKNTVTTKEYTPFGELLTENVSGFGYRGEYYSAETGAVYLRARYYEPELGRFNQKDILRGDISVPASLNRYVYVQNDPVNFIDPSGMRYTVHADVGGGGSKTSKTTNTNSASAPTQSKQTSSAASKASNATKMAYMYSNEARMTGSAAAAKKAAQATSMAYSYANEARMNGDRGSVYKTYGALQAKNTHSSSPRVLSPEQEAACTVYDRKAAIEYADKWTQYRRNDPTWKEFIFCFLLGIGRNHQYASYDSNCTNFISQVLEAGGVETDRRMVF